MTKSVDQLRIKQLLREIELMTPYARLGESVVDHWKDDPAADLDAFSIQETALETGALLPVEGGYNPEIHDDTYGVLDEGDIFYVQAVRASYGL